MDIFVNVHASMIPILTLLKLFQKSKLLINSWGYKTYINLNGGSLSLGAHITWIKFLVVGHTFSPK